MVYVWFNKHVFFAESRNFGIEKKSSSTTASQLRRTRIIERAKKKVLQDVRIKF